MDRKWWTLIGVCVGTFMLLLDVTIVNVALPSIQSSLHASFSDLQWVVDAYALTLAALLLTTGSLADLYGRRRMFLIGLVIFTLSSLLSGLAASPLWLNLARGAQGVGGAAMFATSLALLGSAFQGRERGTAFGAWGAITGLAVAVGPVVGGALTTGLSWRWIFLVNVPIGVVAVAITLLKIDESRQPGARRPDIIGVITFSGALGALVYALIKGNSKGWGSTEIVACLIGSAVLLIAFLIAEVLQRDQAMFDLKLFRKPTFSGGLIAAFSLSAGLFALFLYLTLYMQDILRYSAFQTGLRFLVLSGAILLTSGLAGRLTSVVPIRLLIAPGLACVGVGLLLMRGLTGELGVDAPDPRLHPRRHRHRPGQPAARVDRDRGGHPRPRRHGQRHQLHLPPGGDRHRDRRSGLAVLAHRAHPHRESAQPRPAGRRGGRAPAGRRRGPGQRRLGRAGLAAGPGAAAGRPRAAVELRDRAQRGVPHRRDPHAGVGGADVRAHPQPRLRGVGGALGGEARAGSGGGGGAVATRRRHSDGKSHRHGDFCHQSAPALAGSSTPVSVAQAASRPSWTARSEAAGSAARSMRW